VIDLKYTQDREAEYFPIAFEGEAFRSVHWRELGADLSELMRPFPVSGAQSSQVKMIIKTTDEGSGREVGAVDLLGISPHVD
jgi:hypothetical protein